MVEPIRPWTSSIVSTYSGLYGPMSVGVASRPHESARLESARIVNIAHHIVGPFVIEAGLAADVIPGFPPYGREAPGIGAAPENTAMPLGLMKF